MKSQSHDDTFHAISAQSQDMSGATDLPPLRTCRGDPKVLHFSPGTDVAPHGTGDNVWRPFQV